jgi:hypothetical protein
MVLALGDAIALGTVAPSRSVAWKTRKVARNGIVGRSLADSDLHRSTPITMTASPRSIPTLRNTKALMDTLAVIAGAKPSRVAQPRRIKVGFSAGRAENRRARITAREADATQSPQLMPGSASKRIQAPIRAEAMAPAQMAVVEVEVFGTGCMVEYFIRQSELAQVL